MVIRLEKPEDIAKKKVKNGWIRSWMMIEAMAINKEAVRTALEKHMKNLAGEKNIIILKRGDGEIKQVESPFPNIKEAYSQVIELDVLTLNYDTLIYIVLNYGPSAVEILEPNKIVLGQGEAQGILNTLAALVHRFAAMGGGGLMIST
jgi:hypothetical protein